jgi:transcriptional regulator with XRE-family HTH domain
MYYCPVKERQLLDVVSARIRDRRKDRRLSLDRLAALAGVSKGMLVQIENGQANPSIATLCKVATALGASVADLVQVSGQHPAEVLPAGAPRLLWRGPKGGSATLLVGSAGPDMLELWSWELQPGERYDAEAHPLGTEELLHVVRGRLALAFGEVSYVIESGGSAVAHTDRPHAYACDGKKPVQFTMVVAEWHAPRREARRSR